MKNSFKAILLITALSSFSHLAFAPGTTASTSTNVLQFSSAGHVVGLAGNSVYVAGGSHALHVEFVDSHVTNPVSDAAPSDTQHAASLSWVSYPNLWDGVTLTYDAPNGAIARSTYRIEPHANVDNIRLRYNAPISVQSDGSLRIGFETGTMNESAPQAWQERGGKRVSVRVAFKSRGEHEVGFAVSEYDRAQPLFVDPTLTWNTFLGGSQDDVGKGVAVDTGGNIYVVGYSVASWGSPVRAFSGGEDAFAAKLGSNGNLIWNTFLGGSGTDHGLGISVDASGNIYAAGWSTATWGSPVRAYMNGEDAFAAKLDANGNLSWNTFLGGSGNDLGLAVAADASGNIYVAGQSNATWGSPVRAYTSGGDAFAAKLDANGNLIWNTFLGGSDSDSGSALAADASGNIYVAGQSYATWGSPVRAYAGGLQDAFAAKLDSNGNLSWNTFLGGSGGDNILALTAGASGSIYVAGFSTATWGSPVRAFNSSSGTQDAFAAKLDQNGNLIWNTFLGSGTDGGTAVSVDMMGNAYVAGHSHATWGSPVRAFSGGIDGFAAQLDSNGNLTWNTFLGGGGGDECQGVAVDVSGNVYVVGVSDATWGSPLRAYTSAEDVFVAKLGAPATPTPTPTPINISGTISYCSNPVPGPVPNVTLTLTGTMSGSTLSNGSGSYMFSSLAAGGNYTVTPTKAGLVSGSAGINTVDVVAMQAHVLGRTPLLTGCRAMAADVDQNGSVNTVDVIAVQAFALARTSGFANTGKYKFTPASRTYTGVMSNQTAQNYDTLVFGDVASGYIHRPDGPSQTATDGDGTSVGQVPPTVAKVSLPDVAIEALATTFIAEVKTSAVDAKNKLVGFQGDFTFDERVVTFADEPVQKAGITGGNWNVSGNVLPGAGPIRTLRISAYSNDFAPLTGEGPLFDLNMIRVSKGAQGTQLMWAAPPNQFIFIDADLNTQKPGNAAPGSVGHR